MIPAPALCLNRAFMRVPAVLSVLSAHVFLEKPRAGPGPIPADRTSIIHLSKSLGAISAEALTWESRAAFQAAFCVYFQLQNRAQGECRTGIRARVRRYSAAPIAASVEA